MPRRRRRMTTGRTSGFGSQLRQLAESLYADATVRTTPPSPPEENVKWRERFQSALRQYSAAFTEQLPYCYYRFTLDQVYDSGCVTGFAYDGLDRYLIFVDTSAEQPVVCSCSVSAGEGPCDHGYFFLLQQSERAMQRGTPLYERIETGQLLPGRPSLDQMESAIHLRVLEALGDLPDRLEPPEVDTALPPREQKQPTRIAWNIVTANSSLRIHPLRQQRKKRGDSWTKGKKVSLEALLKSDDLNGVDSKLRSLLQRDRGHYGSNWSLNVFDAIGELEGHAPVLLDGDPAEVERFAPVVYTATDDRSCWFQLKGNGQIFFYENRIVNVDIAQCRVQFFESTHEVVSCISRLARLTPLPLQYKQRLDEKLHQLSDAIEVEIPEEISGPVEPDNCCPVVVLRSSADGSLDYGLRVRDAHGQLHRPGQGPAVRPIEKGKKAIRLQRSFETETRLVRELSERLDLPASGLENTVQDFEQALGLVDRLEALDSDEVEVLWDKSSTENLKVLGSMSSQNVTVGITAKRDWFQLNGTCQLGDHSFDLSELLSALGTENLQSQGEFVRVGDKGWARISARLRKQLTQLRECVSEERKSLKFDATAAPAVRELLSEDLEWQATRAWNKCLERLSSAEQLDPELPSELNAELRSYQLDGFRWLRRLAEWGVGGILADDMGLGKTLQALAVILDRSADGPTLVIAPTSVGFNWIREAEKFAPDLKAHLYRETEREDFLPQIGPGELVVCSYGLALRDAKALGKVKWANLVLDEAQAIKNSRSKRSQAIAKIPADWKLALTGTPVENHLGELWSLFHVISPGVFGSWEQFRRRFAAPIEKNNDDARREALRDRLQPFVLRRTKQEVLTDLPPRTESNIYVTLSPAERAFYDQVRMSVVSEMDEISKLNDVQDQRFRILALLTRMRQLACSPKLVDENWKEPSAKLLRLVDTLHELVDEGHRVLIFSQFVKHLQLIRQVLEDEQISFEYLDGSTPAAKRQQCVDRFQNGDATAFLISLKAGGTGLNLTAADYVIHMDPWWNPAVEDQATDRAHRIGQDKPVMVYRFIAQNTIEDEILRLHESKRDLVAGVMSGTHAAAKLSTEDLIAMVKSGSQTK